VDRIILVSDLAHFTLAAGRTNPAVYTNYVVLRQQILPRTKSTFIPRTNPPPPPTTPSKGSR